MLETQDWKDFSITSWYDKFKHITMETVILELPEVVLDKLIYHPASNQSDGEEEEWDEETPLPEDFKEDFKNALNTLGKTVFIKNNWHSPTDAKMFSIGNALKAQNIDDVILYFTTSTAIQQDFSNVKGVPFCLALRKWISIHPAAEFRCIVINNVLRGITPRDWPTFYGHYKEEGRQIIDALQEFFAENIKENFKRKHYTFDVILSYPDKPYVLDFGPLNSKTNLYAFSWKEINPLLNKEVPKEVSPVFRYLESDIGIMTRAEALRKIKLSE
ncbi:hypothetical protein GWI33_015592 [Rhynchophorus ferrugineus]|uniref:Cell division cycle protein 123 homolog n=1 Tax=Rhynchophorus ferrugineus TaxID=354439 RepID=A0A834I299_RHYFE|nr:hypothetical protein GWI33_015592 [Rhynchophorus ferrugineus]